MSRKMSQAELEAFFQVEDPWKHRTTPTDQTRRDIIVSAVKGKPKRLLEIGCSEGFITERLVADHIVGVDICANALFRCALNLRERIDNHELTLRRMDVYGDLSDLKSYGPFDCVLISDVLYGCLPTEVERLMDLTAPGGQFISCHIKERPYSASFILNPSKGWTFVKVSRWGPYRDIMSQELIVLRRDAA